MYISPIIAIQSNVTNSIINKSGTINNNNSTKAKTINTPIAFNSVRGSIPHSISLPHKFSINVFIYFN